jgi:hypothetical protein
VTTWNSIRPNRGWFAGAGTLYCAILDRLDFRTAISSCNEAAKCDSGANRRLYCGVLEFETTNDCCPINLLVNSRSGAFMRHKKRNTIALLVISMILFAFEAGIWARSTIHARSETDKQNILGRHQPNELPAIAGIFLLIAAAVVAATPPSRDRRRQKNICAQRGTP